MAQIYSSNGGVELTKQVGPSSIQAKGDLASLDKDGDGIITQEEILRFVSKEHQTERENNLLKRTIYFFVLVLIAFSFVGMGMTYAMVELAKDVTTNGDLLVNKLTGNTMQCASSDLVVQDGSLIPRTPSPTPTTSGRRLGATNTDSLSTKLGNNVVNALGVRNVYQQSKLSSTLPDDHFKELVWLDIQSNTGATVSLKILGIFRIPHIKAKCGTYLKLVTASGLIILDDFSIYYDQDMYNVFSEAGLNIVPHHQQQQASTSSMSKQTIRKLFGSGSGSTSSLSSISGMQVIRRLSESDFSLVGFFNSIKNYNWTCTSVEKPEMPAYFSANTTYFKVCEVPSTPGGGGGEGSGRNICYFRSKSGEMIKHFGVVEENGMEYLQFKREMYVSQNVTEMVDYQPYHPGVRSVLQAFNDGLRRSYQIDAFNTLSQCEDSLSPHPMSLSLPDDFIFYALGTTNGMRRFRISYQIDPDLYPMAPKGVWYHIDYFDDERTHSPRVMIDAIGNIIRIDGIKTYENMDTLLSAGLTVESDTFSDCKRVTDIWSSNKFSSTQKSILNGSFTDSLNFNMSMEGLSLSSRMAAKSKMRLLQAWDWYTPYPPKARSSTSYSQQDFYYYLTLFVDHPETPDLFPNWLNYANKTHYIIEHNFNLDTMTHHSPNRRRLALGEIELTSGPLTLVYKPFVPELAFGFEIEKPHLGIEFSIEKKPVPTTAPTAIPTPNPSPKPTSFPTYGLSKPTPSPSPKPTVSPSRSPTTTPTRPTPSPTVYPALNKYYSINGKDQDGQSITRLRSQTATSCAQACYSYYNCRGFVFYPSTGDCWPITGAPSMYDRSSSVIYLIKTSSPTLAPVFSPTTLSSGDALSTYLVKLAAKGCGPALVPVLCLEGSIGITSGVNEVKVFIDILALSGDNAALKAVLPSALSDYTLALITYQYTKMIPGDSIQGTQYGVDAIGAELHVPLVVGLVQGVLHVNYQNTKQYVPSPTDIQMGIQPKYNYGDVTLSASVDVFEIWLLFWADWSTYFNQSIYTYEWGSASPSPDQRVF